MSHPMKSSRTELHSKWVLTSCRAPINVSSLPFPMPLPLFFIWPYSVEGCCICRYAKNPVVLGWHEIRNSLLEQLPPDAVQMGKKVLGYEENDDGTLTVQFQASTCSSSTMCLTKPLGRDAGIITRTLLLSSLTLSPAR
jgi:hypothetical protein